MLEETPDTPDMAEASMRGSMSYCGVFTAELFSELSVSHNKRE